MFFCSPPDGSRSVGLIGGAALASLAAPFGTVDATRALAARTTGLSHGGGVLLGPAETGAGLESLRAGADSPPFAFLRFISLESPNFCSCAPASPRAGCGMGCED